MVSDMTLRRLLPFAVLLLVAACALPAPVVVAPVPVAARLSQQALQVEMSNGSTCSAALTGAAPWRGDLPGCALAFAVTPTAAGSPIRMAFDAMLAALQAGALVTPMAAIALTDATGASYQFTSPVITDQ